MAVLEDLLIDELKDLLHAEMQLTKALPKMTKAARSQELKDAFNSHLEQTEQQVERLKQMFEMMGEKAKGKPCKGMAGLIEEGQEIITEGKEKEDLEADLSLIAAAQKVEHYEISGYGTAREIASQLGLDEVAELLAETLSEEEETDKLLTSLAKPMLEEAASGAEDEESEEEEEVDSEGEEDAAATRKQPGVQKRPTPMAARKR